jgi:hypothetical protein
MRAAFDDDDHPDAEYWKTGRPSPLRTVFRGAFSSKAAYLTLTAFRKSDQTSCILIDCEAGIVMHSGNMVGREENRVEFEEHAVPLSGKLRPYQCMATFGYLFDADGDEDAEPTWAFGFDLKYIEDDYDRLSTTDVWKALTLLAWE